MKDLVALTDYCEHASNGQLEMQYAQERAGQHYARASVVYDAALRRGVTMAPDGGILVGRDDDFACEDLGGE